MYPSRITPTKVSVSTLSTSPTIPPSPHHQFLQFHGSKVVKVLVRIQDLLVRRCKQRQHSANFKNSTAATQAPEITANPQQNETLELKQLAVLGLGISPFPRYFQVNQPLVIPAFRWRREWISYPKHTMGLGICATYTLSHPAQLPEPRKKRALTFHYTGCSIGILLMVYYNPHITG